MKYPDFVEEVQRLTNLNRDRAEIAVAAFLGTLAERLPAKEVRDLEAQVAPELKGYLSTGEPEQRRMTAYEFYERVAEGEGVSHGVAREHAQQVWRVLDMTVKAGELGDILAALPDDLATDLAGVR